MKHGDDLLQAVRAELARLKGKMPLVARQSGVGYYTCQRIKQGEGDPGYSAVAKLAKCLGLKVEVSQDEGDRLEAATALMAACVVEQSAATSA